MAESNNSSYDYLLDYFGEDVISDRFNWLYTMMTEYLKSNDYLEYIDISKSVLNHVIIDYFVDIHRLKDFQEIDITNQIKIYSYLSFWILRHKPLQIKKNDNEQEQFVFINEKFTTEFLRNFIFTDSSKVVILSDDKNSIDDFLDTMLYYFKYRDFSAKSIEMILLAFKAGGAFQHSCDNQR